MDNTMFQFLFLFSIVMFIVEGKHVQQKFNILNLLLPPLPETGNWREVNFDIEGYDGCFEWKADFPKIISLDQHFTDENNENCKNKATVNVISQSSITNILWINAYEKVSGKTFKIETRISDIARVEILTKHRTIDIGDSQVIEIIGYDKEGNSFSTLNGLKFKWTLFSENQALEIVPIAKSVFKSTFQRKILEEKGFQSDNLVVTGLQAGITRVKVVLQDYETSFITDTVNITVVQRFKVHPCDQSTILFKDDTLQFQMALVKTNFATTSLEKLSLPHRNYDFSSSNNTVGIIDKSGFFRAKSHGKTEIKVSDSFILNNTVVCKIFVRRPHSMEISVKEFSVRDWDEREINLGYYTQKSDVKFENLWNLIVGRVYYFRIQIFDYSGNEVFIVDGNRIKANFNTKCFSVIETRNYEVKAKVVSHCGKFNITAESSKYSLHAINNGKTLTRLSFQSALTFIHLPLLAFKESEPAQIFKPFIAGGSGEYSFYIQNTSIIGINGDHYVFPKSLGETIFHVRDKLNFKNDLKVVVLVSQPEFLDFHPKNIVSFDIIQEMWKESKSSVYWRAFGGDEKKFQYSNCTSFIPAFDSNKDVKISQNILDNNELKQKIIMNSIFAKKINLSEYEGYGMCGRASVISRNTTGEYSGSASLRISHLEEISTEANLIVRVYNQLHPIVGTQKLNYLLLTPKSSAVIKLTNGSQVWHSERKLIKSSNISKPSSPLTLVQYGVNTKKLLCVDYTETPTSLRFSQINEADEDLPEPLYTESEISVSCSEVEKLQILLAYQSKEEEIDFQKYYLVNNFTHKFKLKAFDGYNRAFYNFSGMAIEWELNSKSNSFISKENFQTAEVFIEENYEGELKLVARNSRKINTKAITFFKSKTQHQPFKNYVSILYKGPSTEYNLSVLHGSGIFDCLFKSSEFFKSRSIVDGIINVKTQSKGTDSLRIDDTYVIGSVSKLVMFEIRELQEIRIPDSILLFRNDEAEVKIELFPKFDNVRNSDFEIICDQGFIKPSWRNSTLIIKGLQTGETKLKVHSNISSTPIIKSNTADIFILNKISSNPSKVVIAPGCQLCVKIINAPNEKAKVMFGLSSSFIIDDEIVEAFQTQNDLFHIIGKKVGEGMLRYVIKKGNEIFEEVKIQVLVGIVDSVEIVSLQSPHTSSTSRVLSVLRVQNFIISPALCPFSLSWRLSNAKTMSVAHDSLENKLKLAEDKANGFAYDSLSNFNFGANLTIFEEAVEYIELTARLRYGGYYKAEEKIVTKKIVSIQKPSFFSPSYISQSDFDSNIVILAKNSKYQLPSSVNSYKSRGTFQISSDPPNTIAISQDQIEVTGKCIHGEFKIFFNSHLVFSKTISTEEIHGLFLEDSHKLLSLPTEGNSMLNLRFLDKFGRVFANGIVGIEVKISFSHPHVVESSIGKGNRVNFRGLRRGVSLSRISLEEDNGIFESFIIVVGSIITPSSPIYVHQGGFIRFQASVPMSKNAIWKSGNENILTIDKNGKAEAQAEGIAIISFIDSVTFDSKVSVFKASKIALDKSVVPKMTNIKESEDFQEEYKLRFRIFSESFEIKKLSISDNSQISNSLRFNCESDNPQFFLVKGSTVTVNSGEYDENYCLIRARKNFPFRKKIPNSLVLIVSVENENGKGFELKRTFTFEYSWAFLIPPPKIVILNDKEKSKMIQIPSNFELEFKCVEPYNSLLNGFFDKGVSIFYMNITIPANYQQNFETIIHFCNPITGQKESLIVQFDPHNGVSKGFSLGFIKFSFSKTDFIITLSIIVVIAVIYNNFKSSVFGFGTARNVDRFSGNKGYLSRIQDSFHTPVRDQFVDRYWHTFTGNRFRRS